MSLRKKRLAAGVFILGAVMTAGVLYAAPANATVASSAPTAAAAACTITITSAPSGLLWGTTTKVTHDNCGSSVKVRAFIACNVEETNTHYGKTRTANGTTSTTCTFPADEGSRFLYGYQKNTGSGWKTHWIGQ